MTNFPIRGLVIGAIAFAAALWALIAGGVASGIYNAVITVCLAVYVIPDLLHILALLTRDYPLPHNEEPDQ